MAACALSGCRQADRAAPHHTPSDFRGPLSLNTPLFAFARTEPRFQSTPSFYTHKIVTSSGARRGHRDGFMSLY